MPALVLALVALLTSWLPGPAAAVSRRHEVRGYVRQYGTLTHDASPDWLASTRARVQLRWFPSFAVTVACDYETVASGGSLLEAAGASLAAGPGRRRRELLNLTWLPVSEPRARLRHGIDRAFVEYYSASWTATVGRQRIAWGVSRYFRPLDAFAPFAPAQVDKEERLGIDAARVRWTAGQLTDVEAVYDPGRGWDDERLGLRCRTHRHGWDLSAAAGRFGHGTAWGGAVAGSSRGAGLHAEGTVTHGDDSTWLVAGAGGPPRELAADEWYARLTAGAEYGFAWRNLTLAGEVHYNGAGRSAPSEYDWAGLATGRHTVLGRRMAAAHASLLGTPLLTCSAALLLNADDRSALVQPQLHYSLAPRWALTVASHWTRGRGNTEFGSLPDATYGYLSWHY